MQSLIRSLPTNIPTTRKLTDELKSNHQIQYKMQQAGVKSKILSVLNTDATPCMLYVFQVHKVLQKLAQKTKKPQS